MGRLEAKRAIYKLNNEIQIKQKVILYHQNWDLFLFSLNDYLALQYSVITLFYSPEAIRSFAG